METNQTTDVVQKKNKAKQLWDYFTTYEKIWFFSNDIVRVTNFKRQRN